MTVPSPGGRSWSGGPDEGTRPGVTRVLFRPALALLLTACVTAAPAPVSPPPVSPPPVSPAPVSPAPVSPAPAAPPPAAAASLAHPLAALPPMSAVVLPSASPIVSVRLVFRAGSWDDPKGKEGVTALTTRLLVEGGTEELSADRAVRRALPDGRRALAATPTRS